MSLLDKPKGLKDFSEKENLVIKPEFDNLDPRFIFPEKDIKLPNLPENPSVRRTPDLFFSEQGFF